jgi:PAS domain S-box-containing protein
MFKAPTKTILVVDDNEAKRYSIRRYLIHAGFLVVEGGTGQDALRLAQDQPELIILDVKLPDEIGWSICTKLKQNPNTNRIPVLQISATFHKPSEKVRSLESGADAFLVAPVDPGELVAVVKVLLRLKNTQDLLRESNERLSSVLSSITEAYFLMDEKGTFLEGNPAAESFFGRPMEELAGKNIWVEFPPGANLAFHEQYCRVLEGQIPSHFEAASWIAPHRWFEAHIYFREGRLETYLHEITTRKEAEQALRLSEERFRVTLKNSPIVCYTNDTELRYTWMHDPGHYFDIGDFMGQRDDQCLPPEEVFELMEMKRTALRTGLGLRREIQLKIGGDPRWYDHTIEPLRDSRNQITGLTVAAFETTSWRRAQDNLRESKQRVREHNERLQLLYQTVGRLLSTNDLDQILRETFQKVADHLALDAYFNFFPPHEKSGWSLHSCAGISAEAFTGISTAQLGMRLHELAGSSNPSAILTADRESNDPELDWMRRQGLRALACFPLEAAGCLLGVLAFASRTRHDFQEDQLLFMRTLSHYVAIAFERLNREAELHQAKSDLELKVEERTAKLQETVHELKAITYSITHDLRAPLRAMQGFSQMVMDEHGPKLNAEGLDYLERIVNAAGRMDLLITDVLAYGKIVQSDIPMSSVDLDKLIRDFTREYPTLHTSHAELEIEGRLPVVLGNEALLTQCFSNLLSNAIKFVSPGTRPRIRVRSETNENCVRIFIQDNGIGVSPEYQDRIFRLFERLHAAHEYSGTGIGLTIVRKSVERMGGRAGLQPDCPNGSCFWIELSPAAPASHLSP